MFSRVQFVTESGCRGSGTPKGIVTHPWGELGAVFCVLYDLGVTGFPKMDVFLENSQTAFDPPPSFLEITLRFFLRKFVNMR